MKTASERILEVLAGSVRPICLHEFGILGVSQTAISARLRELAKEGKVRGQYREGTRTKEWELVPQDSCPNSNCDFEDHPSHKALVDNPLQGMSLGEPELVYIPERWV